MKNLWLAPVVFCSIATLWPVYGQAGGPALDALYKVGQSREYELAQPKNYFLGSQTANIIGAPVGQIPRREEDFNKEYIRAEIVGKQSLDGGQRVVIRLDKIDKEGQVITDGNKPAQPLYYMYVDVSAEGTRVVSRRTDDSSDAYDTTTWCGMPFPFSCARPPAAGFTKTRNDGYVDKCGVDVAYTLKKAATPQSPNIEVDATQFILPHAFEKSGIPTIHWSDADATALIKAEPKARILFREKQRWDKADDWLWRKMERIDAKGNGSCPFSENWRCMILGK